MLILVPAGFLLGMIISSLMTLLWLFGGPGNGGFNGGSGRGGFSSGGFPWSREKAPHQVRQRLLISRKIQF